VLLIWSGWAVRCIFIFFSGYWYCQIANWWNSRRLWSIWTNRVIILNEPPTHV